MASFVETSAGARRLKRLTANEFCFSLRWWSAGYWVFPGSDDQDLEAADGRRARPPGSASARIRGSGVVQ